ncbi:MAG TPA: FAD-binding oxidoreductase [Acidimicrobiia bacterium]|nr:FAD-binding oxidoreductase [Acidimicrobiia bacterium]
MKAEQPGSYEEAAELLRAASADGRTVRFRGGGTKFGWGRAGPETDLELCTGGLDRVLEHNAGDFTAVLQAGVPLAVAQAALASAGQQLALDPPLSPWGGAGDDAAIEATDAGATIGGIVATNDSGPLRHRYGGVRDLVVGVTVILSDGTIARAGGKVIKNVAGYDLGKLFAGAYGTLGMIAEVTVRLHPVPPRTATVVARSADPAALAAAAAALMHAPLEADSLDLWWDSATPEGAVLVRFASADPAPRAEEATALLRRLGGVDDTTVRASVTTGVSKERTVDLDVDTEDEPRWEAQRRAQRSDVVVKVSALPAALPAVLAAAQALGGTMVARAGLGLAWVQLPLLPAGGMVEAIGELRRRVAPAPAVVLDAPGEVRAALDPWGLETGPVELMRKVKERFDPAGICAPGLFVGGI